MSERCARPTTGNNRELRHFRCRCGHFSPDNLRWCTGLTGISLFRTNRECPRRDQRTAPDGTGNGADRSGKCTPGVMRGRRSLPGDLDRSGLVMPRRPIPTCGLALFSRLSDCLGVTIPDHSSTDLCQGGSSATVALGHITSPGRPASRRHLSVDVRCRGGRAGGAMPRGVGARIPRPR